MFILGTGFFGFLATSGIISTKFEKVLAVIESIHTCAPTHSMHCSAMPGPGHSSSSSSSFPVLVRPVLH